MSVYLNVGLAVRSVKKKIIQWDLTFLLVGIMLLASQIWVQMSAASTKSDQQGSWFIDMSRYSISAHGTFSCEKCHGQMNLKGKAHPDLTDTKVLMRDAIHDFDYKRCELCHRESYKRYIQGEHTKALAEQSKKATAESGQKKRRAPTCGDCHDIHYEKAHRSRVSIGRDMTQVCGQCHLEQRITYLQNIHGKRAVGLGYALAAYCTDCHGAHKCISLKDKKVALRVCQRCHPNAEIRFAEFVIHPTLKGLSGGGEHKKARVRVIRLIATIMTIIVIVVVGFFYSHNLLWILRELHERLRKH